MMIALTVMNLALCAMMVYQAWEARKERNMLIRALMSRNAAEFVATERASQPEAPREPKRQAYDEMWAPPPVPEE